MNTLAGVVTLGLKPPLTKNHLRMMKFVTSSATTGACYWPYETCKSGWKLWATVLVVVEQSFTVVIQVVLPVTVGVEVRVYRQKPASPVENSSLLQFQKSRLIKKNNKNEIYDRQILVIADGGGWCVVVAGWWSVLGRKS